jgi:hypothetical protein
MRHTGKLPGTNVLMKPCSPSRGCSADLTSGPPPSARLTRAWTTSNFDVGTEDLGIEAFEGPDDRPPFRATIAGERLMLGDR